LIDLTGVQLLLNDFEAGLCSIFRASRRLRCAHIRLQCAQSVRNILECGNDGGAILGFGLIKSCLSRLLFVVERKAIEEGRGCTRCERIKSGSGRKTLGEVVGGRPAIGLEHEIWQPGSDRDTNLSARRMHVGFRCPDVGSLINKLAGQADRKVRRQLEMRKIEFLENLVG